MSKPVEATEFLAHPNKHPAAVCVVFGDEAFLQRQVIAELKHAVLGEDDGDLSLATFAGDDITLRDVLDELSTVALFGSGKRLVIVEEAEPFVTRYRAELEDYVAKPRSKSVLVLAPTSWPSNTRLFKALAESGLQIECKTPPPAKLLKWLTDWAKRRHQAKLDSAAAEALVEIVEPELGLFDQELAKLAALAGEAPITAEIVREAVGGWRVKTTWDMLDAAANGAAAEAIVQLDRLLLAGEAPIAVLGQIASTLRRFAAATRIIENAEAERRRVSLKQALEEAGFKPFVLAKAESQLRQLGRTRAGKLYAWLLEADLALKGASSSPARARFVLEQLIARMAKQSPLVTR
jgi:DNA polymerase III subunit delta